MKQTSVSVRTRQIAATRCRGRRIGLGTLRRLSLLVTIFLIASQTARSDHFSREGEFVRRLEAPMTSLLDGKPFRDALESLASEAGVNLWLDRRVDPSVPVDAGPVGPTVFTAIEKLADSRDCSLMAIERILLVGRESWVDETSAAILSIPEIRLGDRIDVAWPELTTPQEALKQVAADSDDGPFQLPHDHWPAVNWKQIERQVAIALILAQFADAEDRTDKPGGNSRRITRRYARGPVPLGRFSRVLKAADASAQLRVSPRWIVAEASMTAHREATCLLLREAAKGSRPDPDRDTFTLKKMTTSAENALRQLANTAGKTCVIEPSAAKACKQLITLEGQDVTLRQLVDLVASQAGLTARWQGDTIVISRSDPAANLGPAADSRQTPHLLAPPTQATP